MTLGDFSNDNPNVCQVAKEHSWERLFLPLEGLFQQCFSGNVKGETIPEITAYMIISCIYTKIEN